MSGFHYTSSQQDKDSITEALTSGVQNWSKLHWMFLDVFPQSHEHE
jgi:hypothetical protein